MNEHVAGEVLAAFVDRALDAGLRPGVEAHLSRCPECREELAAVLAMRKSRENIPAEFLRRALDVASDAPRGLRLPGRTTRPARLVFGVAAVFLVAALLGYFFLGRNGMVPAPASEKALPSAGPRRPHGGLPLPAGAALDEPPPARDAGIGATREGTPQLSLPARKTRAAEADGLKMEKKSLVEEAQAGPPAAPVPAKAGQAQATGDEKMALRREAEGGTSGGVLGGVAAPLEKDKASDMRLAAAPAAQFKGAGMEDARRQRSRFPGSGASGDAMQLFLAATGRAAAPRAFPAPETPSLRLRIEGDVASADLLDPGILDSWDWFPEGRGLELTIDAAGAVNAVKLLGDWDGREAERAREAVMKLAFPPSARATRRAVLSR